MKARHTLFALATLVLLSACQRSVKTEPAPYVTHTDFTVESLPPTCCSKGFSLDGFPSAPPPSSLETRIATITDNTRKAFPTGIEERRASLGEFYRNVDQPLQTFTVSSQRAQAVVCDGGTVLYIPEGAFVSAITGLPIQGPVEMLVKEYVMQEDILLAPLSTRTRDRLLETAGMVYLEAIAGAEPCELARGKSIDIRFPQADNKPGMHLFSGVQLDDGTIIWEPMQTQAPPSGTREVRRLRLVHEWVERVAVSNYDVEYRYPGGKWHMYRHFNRRVASRWRNMDMIPRGTVSADFTLGADGLVRDIAIRNSVHQGVDSLLVRALRNTPRWRGARLNAERVPVSLNISIKLNRRDMDFVIRDQYNAQFEEWQRRISRGEPYYISGGNVYTYRYDTASAVGNLVSDVFQTSRLGWINCDRFVDSRAPLIAFRVETEDAGNTDVKLVFRSMRSVLSGELRQNQFLFSGVPSGAPVTVVAIRRSGGETQVATRDVELDSGVLTDLQFTPIDNEALRTMLAAL